MLDDTLGFEFVKRLLVVADGREFGTGVFADGRRIPVDVRLCQREIRDLPVGYRH